MNTNTTSVKKPTIQQPNAQAGDQPVKLSEAAGDAAESFRKYAAQRPDVVALWAFGVGFVLGWKLKPW